MEVEVLQKKHKYRSAVWNPPGDILEIALNLGRRRMRPQAVCDYLGIQRGAWDKAVEENPDIEIEYRRGLAQTEFFASEKLLEQIGKGDTKAIVFFLERQAKWMKEIQPHEKDVITTIEVEYPKGMTDPVHAAKVYAELMLRS